MRNNPGELEDHLGYWLRKLSNAVSHAFAGRLERHDISVPQWVVLRVIYDHEALTLKEIVARVGVDQGSLSRMVERLLVRGLVSRVVDSRDRRAVAISLTREGRELVPKLAREADENDRAFFGKISDGRRAQLLKTVKELLRANSLDNQGMPLE